MEWLNQDFQGLHFDTQAINETSSSWGLTWRSSHPPPPKKAENKNHSRKPTSTNYQLLR